MDFSSVDSLANAGFVGFIPFGALNAQKAAIPKEQGVYLIIRPEGHVLEFLPVGTGGHFRGRDPNVSVAELTANWVGKTIILYIGKAGGSTSASTLRKRLIQYAKFGEGKAIGHSGGRYIWQLRDNKSLLVCWRVAKDEPSSVESGLIADFKSCFGVRPFANLRD